MAHDPRIDDYIAKAAPFAQPILKHIRQLVHGAVPGVDETIKWGMPSYTHKDKIVAGMAAFKAHAAFFIYGESRAQFGKGKGGKILKLADLPSKALIKKKLNEAVLRIETKGTAQKPRSRRTKPKADIPVPQDFAEALSKEADEFFERLAPSYRREYLEWIVEAKRPETRARRIAQAAEWLAEGKKRNWKYENC